MARLLMLTTLAAALMDFVALNGPDGQIIYVNPIEVVSVRAPTSNLIHSSIRCVLQTTDGKLINVTNTCKDVMHKIGRSYE